MFRSFSRHYPVMWRDILKILEENLSIHQNLLMADCTLGLGGHSRCILETFPNAYIISTDMDPSAISHSSAFLESFKSRISINHSNYIKIFDFPRFPGIFPKTKKFDAILMDLGMSSLQLDDPNRGFSFKSTGELDMRFDTSDENCLTAFKVINFASELEITEIFSKFGEEKDAQVAAGMICKYRNEQKITNPAQLAKVLNYAFFTSKAVNKYDCITRCFQALRIFVNRELDNVQTLIKLAFNQLGPGGVLLVISFHSLEDILVLKAMKEHTGRGKGGLKTWSPIIASQEELKENSRSRSARLRYFKNG